MAEEGSLQLRASGRPNSCTAANWVGQQRHVVEFHRQTLGCFQVFVALGTQAWGIAVLVCMTAWSCSRKDRSLAQSTKFEAGPPRHQTRVTSLWACRARFREPDHLLRWPT